ncbi:MAG: hypothetical protein ACRDMA_08275 [Solirubrobacterales bacterium]
MATRYQSAPIARGPSVLALRGPLRSVGALPLGAVEQAHDRQASILEDPLEVTADNKPVRELAESADTNVLPFVVPI